jgi:DNA-binding transcriptional MerR regulator
MDDERLLTVTESAGILDRSSESVRNYNRRGILPAQRVGRRGMRLFREEDVRALAKLLKKERLGFQPAVKRV